MTPAAFFLSDTAWLLAAAVWGLSLLVLAVIAVQEWRYWRREQARRVAAPLIPLDLSRPRRRRVCADPIRERRGL